MSIDIAYFLTDRVGFIQSFYETCAAPLELIKRQIETGEMPYVPPSNEDEGEPPFTSDWIEAQEKLDVLGFCCLSLLQGALKAYLKGYIDRFEQTWPTEFPDIWQTVNKVRKKSGWFDQYGSFLKGLSIDWSNSEDELTTIEQITFVRNDFMHADDLSTMVVYQSKEHFERFPVPTFAHEFEHFVRHEEPEVRYPAQLRISAEKLILAVKDVQKLCRWLERRWQQGFATA